MTLTAEQAGADLRAFVDASPSPFHAVSEITRRLSSEGFTPLHERDVWALAPGDTRYVVRDGGSVIAFRVGTAPAAEAGLRLVGTHTDSPTFKVRPRYDLTRGRYRLVGVEPYGGLLAHTWLDRELTVAGRLATRSADGGVELHAVRLPGGPPPPAVAGDPPRPRRARGPQARPRSTSSSPCGAATSRGPRCSTTSRTWRGSERATSSDTTWCWPTRSRPQPRASTARGSRPPAWTTWGPATAPRSP
jgi:hypothetical protein